MDFIKNLCKPAYFYFLISIFFFIFIFIQNIFINNGSRYCIGMYECNKNNKWMLLFSNLLYIIFWTYVLNFICNLGYPKLSWFIVLLPFISSFLLIGILLLNFGYATLY